MTTVALIVAAGSGSRVGGDVPKQFRWIGGKSVLAHAVDALASHPRIDAVRIVERDPIRHFGDVFGRMKIIGVIKVPAEMIGERPADAGLAAP